MDVSRETKEKVYGRIKEYLEIEGYPAEAESDFKVPSIIDLVYATISLIPRDSIRTVQHKNISLRREKEIIGTDKETGGYEESVVVDLISVTEEKFIIVRREKEFHWKGDETTSTSNEITTVKARCMGL